MFNHFNLRDPVLINTVGHTAGVLLFGLIIVLIVRDWRDHGVRQTKLSLVAAVLALGWNVGSLIALATGNQDSLVIGLVMTASFGILSMLPAVLLQVVLGGQHRWLTVSGYLISIAAVILHFTELLLPSQLNLHHLALVVIAAGYAAITVSVLLNRLRRPRIAPSNSSEWLSPAALLLFTSSFLHFGYEHVASPWSAEIAWHHIGIPVALIVLLQDYRFLLLDTFLRFLMNSGLAAVYIGAVISLSRHFGFLGNRPAGMFAVGLGLVALCLSLVLFAYVRNALQAWVSRVVFRRQSLDECIRKIVQCATQSHSEQELFDDAAREVAEYLQTEHFVILDEPMTPQRTEKPSVLFGVTLRQSTGRPQFHAEAQIPLRFSGGDTRYLVAGARRGGRRYFSEELDDMRRLGTVIVEQVERFRADELRRLASEAELRALQAQINPHFLFNALNTLYGSIDRKSVEARRTVLNLADIFRYLLQNDRSTIQLSEELRIVQAYLEIESLRLGDRLETELLVSETARFASIPILTIQPLVENAVKHGIAAKGTRGRISLRAHTDDRGLHVAVEDTGIGFDRSSKRVHRGTGVGLANVRRRLLLSYGPEADLVIASSAEGSVVSFFIPHSASAEAPLADQSRPLAVPSR